VAGGNGDGNGIGGTIGNMSSGNEVTNEEEDPGPGQLTEDDIFYYITYELNGGYIEGEPNPTSYKKGSAVVIRNPRKKDENGNDIAFRGWSGSDFNGIKQTIAFQNGTGNKFYVANWNSPSFQIINPNGETLTRFTLKEAIEDATDGARIKTLANVIESERLDEINKQLTIDLQGKAITLTYAMTIGVAGDITIIDSGDIATGELSGRISGLADAAIVNKGQLKIGNDDGNILFFPYIIGKQYGVSSPNGEVGFYDGTVTAVKGINATKIFTPSHYYAMADKNGDGTESVSLRTLGKTVAKIDFNYFADLQSAVDSVASMNQAYAGKTTLREIGPDMVEFDVSENYFFYASDDALSSNNLNINNSRAYSYIKVDLTRSSTDYSYKISLKGNISSEENRDYGYVYVTDSVDKPDLNSNVNQIMKISGNVMDQEAYKMVEGGGIYYIHLFYTKDRSNHAGSDTFWVTDLHVEKYDGYENLGEEKVLVTGASADSNAARIVLVADTVVASTITIDNTKNLILDLNGHILNTVGTITTFNNYGKLRITDTSLEKTGRIINANTFAVLSNGNVALENLNLDYTTYSPRNKLFDSSFVRKLYDTELYFQN